MTAEQKSEYCPQCDEHFTACQCMVIEIDNQIQDAQKELNAISDFIKRTNTPNKEAIQPRINSSVRAIVYWIDQARARRMRQLHNEVRCKECSGGDIHYNQYKQECTCKDCGLVWCAK